MKITDAKTIVFSPGRNFVTLKLTTEHGVYGPGDAALNGRELAVASCPADHVIPPLAGRDARRIVDLWHYLYLGAHWRNWLAACAFLAFALPARAQRPGSAGEVSAEHFSKEVTAFLGRQIALHVADIHTLDPPQERVVGALATGEFSWGTFMRALAAYSELSGQSTVAGRNVPRLIGQIGLIEARNGGKSFAQMYAALALRSFGLNLAANPVWQSLDPGERAAWRSLLDPSRFYDRKTRQVIGLPQNYYGVAARVVAIDAQLGILKDHTFVNDVLDRAAQQFTSGALYADDDIPHGRYDRYSNEYARYVYFAAEDAGRKDILAAMRPTLETQMHTWWDLLSPDGYGYPWGRSLGDISYMDTIEIVAFLAQHPQFRPAPMPRLAAAYYAAWRHLEGDFIPGRPLLNVFGFGRGNYSYIDPSREWQQTTAFFGKLAAAQKMFDSVMRQERIASFPSSPALPEVARFDYFRHGPPSAGVWLVRRGALRFALPITGATHPGVADYLPAPYGLPGFSNPVEQFVPALAPYLELADGRVVVAAGLASQIVPEAGGLSLKATWNRWSELGSKPGSAADTGLADEVTWTIRGNTLLRTETLTASSPMRIRDFWVVVPTTASTCATSFANGVRTDRCDSPEGSIEVAVTQSDWRLRSRLRATGDSVLGRGSRGPVPLYIEYEAGETALQPNHPMKWTVSITSIPPPQAGKNRSLSQRLVSKATGEIPKPRYLH